MKRKFLFFGHISAPQISVKDVDTLIDMAKDNLTLGQYIDRTSIVDIAFNPEGSLVAILYGNNDIGLSVYRTHDWSKVEILSGNVEGFARYAKFTPDGNYLAVVHSRTPYLTVYKTSDWSKVVISGGLPALEALILNITPDGRYLLVGIAATSQNLLIYDTIDWSRQIHTITGMPNVRCIEFSNDGALLAYGGATNPYLSVFKFPSMEVLNVPRLTSYHNFVFFDKTGEKLIVGTTDSAAYIRIYNTVDWSFESFNSQIIPASPVNGAYDDENNQIFISFDNARSLIAFDLNTKTVKDIPSSRTKTNVIKISPPIGGTVSNADTVPVTDNLNIPVVRRVTALDRDEYKILANTKTGQDGRYDLPILKTDKPLTIIFQADSDIENSVVVDWVMAE